MFQKADRAGTPTSQSYLCYRDEYSSTLIASLTFWFQVGGVPLNSNISKLLLVPPRCNGQFTGKNCKHPPASVFFSGGGGGGFVVQSYPTLCNPTDCSPPGSSVPGISQARILEWVVISFSRGSSPARDWTHISCTGRQILYGLSHLGSICLLLWSLFQFHGLRFNLCLPSITGRQQKETLTPNHYDNFL